MEDHGPPIAYTALAEGVPVYDASGDLHEPGENPAVMEAQPEDTSEGDLERRLRRAWDWISGRY